MPRVLTRAAVLRHRLAGQFLSARGPASAADVVRALGAVQAQDFAGAKWAIGMRMPTATDASVEREFVEGRMLRTHVLRPTWHFVAPEDLRWMLALTSPRINAAMAYYDRSLGLTASVYRRSNDAIARALEGGAFLTRTELSAVLRRARVKHARGQPLNHLMMRAETDAVVTSGPLRGRQFTYALLDERVAQSKPRDRDESMRELALRYCSTRGPATVHDFSWWSGLTVRDAQRAIEIAGNALQQATFEERNVWFVERSLGRAALTGHLLPNYDEYFIGHRDRSAIGGRLGSVSKVTGGSFLITHVALVNGELVGAWRRVKTKHGVRAKVTINAQLSARERAVIEKQVERLHEFLGC